MSVNNFEELKKHIGHKIVCVSYAYQNLNVAESKKKIRNVAIECETCNEVLLDFDKEETD